MKTDDSTGESKLFGVSIRSWNATIIIAVGTVTICWLAIERKDANQVMMVVMSALSYLFGKASGANTEKLKQAQNNVP